jgi:hypothetical protein
MKPQSQQKEEGRMDRRKEGRKEGWMEGRGT